MRPIQARSLLALAVSLGVHAALLLWSAQPPRSPVEPEVFQMRLVQPPPPEPAQVLPKPTHNQAASEPASEPPPAPPRRPATLAAPPAPTAEDWQLAATYTLKNSKRYRYNWGQQVRSMMGTAIAGERQGLVRVRVEIAPTGKLARVEVLWSTSDQVEKLALDAIRAMPPLPPTPTGEPLVFEKTIALLPFETGWPPIYKYDCLPDPVAFRNPFAQNGGPPPAPAPSPAARAATQPECPDTGPDSIEAEEKDMERQFKEWRSMDLEPR